MEVPSSIAGVRAALEPDRAAEFDAVVARTPAKHLVYVILDWTLPRGAEKSDAVTVGRLRGGDFSGVRDGDGNPVTPTHPPLDETQEEPAPAVWSTGFPIGSKTFPATIDGIRGALDQDRRAEFEAEITRTPGHELTYAALRWGYPPEDLAEEDALVAELRAAHQGRGEGL
ncbi:hypothetical protein [Streptomyces qinzhouensis]|uniref:Uncharacterized protein n=1 Tax=Streptomyces qinzhouensis TaxID=2599401 RepID=A0A5B8J6W0_9ACTN|nr:hypothetical protein [Streptomyces qinzhouensis]QDY76956.1 hypothetical protein FQU76_10960 [Streptomyces qinzhouensis]